MKNKITQCVSEYGYNHLQYSSRGLNFTIFYDGSGDVEILHKNNQLFVSESGKHSDKIRSIEREIKTLRKEADALETAVKEMKKYSKRDIKK